MFKISEYQIEISPFRPATIQVIESAGIDADGNPTTSTTYVASATIQAAGRLTKEDAAAALADGLEAAAGLVRNALL